MAIPIPLEDGTTHINIYTKGQTTLGRWLSNIYECNVVIDDVTFRSLENYWHWLQASEKAKAQLIRCSPWEAKEHFKLHPENRVRPIGEDLFFALFKQAMKQKLFQHPRMAKVFAASTLPFAHYYQYGGKPVLAGHQWMVAHWEEIRSNPRFKEWVNSHQ